jgi:uncharacterized protein (DUF4415 family)
MSKKWVDPDDAPPLTRKDASNPTAQWQIGGKSVTAEEGRAEFRKAFRSGKTRVNIHLDNEIIADFKEKAGAGGGYQTLINAALREYIKNSNAKANAPAAVESVGDAHAMIAEAIRFEMDKALQLMIEQYRLQQAHPMFYRFQSGATGTGGIAGSTAVGSNNSTSLIANTTTQDSNWNGFTH